MATDLGRVKSTPASKYDSLVSAQLKQAETRIRVLDLTAGLLGFAALSLAYVVVMLLCDNKLLLSPTARQLSLYAFLAGAAVYLYWVLIRPLRLRVNPYYAARQVEQQLPQAKNSIVNWVDLHDQALPPAIRGALSQRAAKDLSHVDLDRAISGRRTAWMGGLAGLFAVAFIAAFFLLGPRPFLSLLQRMFNPFAAAGVSTRTQLKLLKPEGGDATVTVGHGINFVVEVNGKVPNPKAADAVKLLYRYEEGDPWLERRLVQESSGDWTTSMSAIEIKNGFWYKVTGGDVETEEYRVGVRAAPSILDFLATYRFRPYVARMDEVRRERELKALCGTEVLLRVRTNRTLRDGRLEFESNGRADGVNTPVASVRGEVDANDPRTLLVRFIINEDGKYRLFFTSTESESYREQASYPVTAIPDKPPTVELSKPGKDIRLPADALLHLEGKAGDDIGVKSLILQMRVIDGSKLRGQPYRAVEKLRLADGGYPRELEYKDYVELARVKDENGQAYPLRAGLELEYWLEASDACDYPRPHIAESKHFRVKLIDPEKNPPKQKQEKQQAENNKKQHEKKQDQQLQKENQDRQQQRQEQQTRNKEEENKGQNGSEGNKKEENNGQNGSEGTKGAASDKSQPKDGQQGNNGENRNKAQQGENKNGQGETKKAEQNNGQADENQKIEDRIKKALEKNQAGGDGKGKNKPDKSDPDKDKSAQSEKPGGSDKSQGGNKGSGQQDAKDTGEGKNENQPQAGRDPAQKDGKSDKSDPKGSDSGKRAGKAGTDKGKPESALQSGQEKSSGDQQTSKGGGHDKPKPKDQGKDPTQGNRKPSGDKEKQQNKPESTNEPKGNSNSGESKGDENRKKEDHSEQKQGSSAPKGEHTKRGTDKPSASKRDKENSAETKNQPDGDTQPRDATAKEIQDLAGKLGSKDPREREQAKRQLQRIEKEASNPKSREQAGDALKKMGKPDNAAGKETPKKDNGSSDNEKEKGKENAKKDASQDGGSSGEKGGDKGEGNDPNQKNGQGDKKGTDSSTDGPSGETQKNPGGNTPGGGQERRSGGGRSETQDTASPPKQEKPRDHRAAEMQLEDFAKRVNKDILKEAGVSEAAWKKYLESKRKQLAPRDKPRPEGPINSQQASQLPSMGGQTIKPTTSGKGDTRGLNRGQPLPAYRDAHRKFTEQMSGKN